MSNNDNNNIQAVVFATCDQMLREDIPMKRITGRPVSAKVEWSHTTVTPYVNIWRDRRAEEEREAIKKTQMSQHFVRALQKEVEDRIGVLRDIDVEQMAILQTELQDIIDTNSKLESELKTTKQELSVKTGEASQSAVLVTQLQSRYSTDVEDLKSEIKDKESKANIERKELKDEHRDAIQKLTEKKDEIHSDLKAKSAECAEAKVKADNFEKVSNELESKITECIQLSGDVIRLSADIETKQHALETVTQSMIDCNHQRDKAQSAREASEVELRELHLAHQTLMTKVAVDLESKTNENIKLSGDVIRLSADIETKQHALNSAEQTTSDYKNQRDKAQTARDSSELELRGLRISHQNVLVQAAKNPGKI